MIGPNNQRHTLNQSDAKHQSRPTTCLPAFWAVGSPFVELSLALQGIFLSSARPLFLVLGHSLEKRSNFTWPLVDELLWISFDATMHFFIFFSFSLVFRKEMILYFNLSTMVFHRWFSRQTTKHLGQGKWRAYYFGIEIIHCSVSFITPKLLLHKSYFYVFVLFCNNSCFVWNLGGYEN